MNGLNRHPYLHVDESDTKRLRKEFNDDRIYIGRNVQVHENQAWYKPDSGPAYKICGCENVAHASMQLNLRSRYEKSKAKNLLAEIDAHNDKIVTDKEEETMREVRSTLKSVASGRIMFMT